MKVGDITWVNAVGKPVMTGDPAEYDVAALLQQLGDASHALAKLEMERDALVTALRALEQEMRSDMSPFSGQHWADRLAMLLEAHQ